MKIAAIIVTHNRLLLLERALNSVADQHRQADFVVVVSNSDADLKVQERQLCSQFGIEHIENRRTQNYAGALNTGVEEVIRHLGIWEDVYFASLDDDDVWLPAYLARLESENSENVDLVIADLERRSTTFSEILTLPRELSMRDFLIGNPGVCGSNTFLRLKTLLFAGAFDEALEATVDRDFMVRVFQLLPTYRVIGQQLVTQYVEEGRARLTNSGRKKQDSLVLFYYKFQHLMQAGDKQLFKQRAKDLFLVDAGAFEAYRPYAQVHHQHELSFREKGDYQFIIGFITGDPRLCEQIVDEIIGKQVPADLVVVIDNTNGVGLLNEAMQKLVDHAIPYQVIARQEWLDHLQSGRYGQAFEEFTSLNSVPLGRSILHHHLFQASLEFGNPVFWVIDDDVNFASQVWIPGTTDQDLFALINAHKDKVDAIVGGVSNDPPLPFLCTIRCQLVDFLYSHQAGKHLLGDIRGIRYLPDYYYDITDLHSDHLEYPLYHDQADESALLAIFSGKGVSRKVIQGQPQAIEKIVAQRGPNTLVFNREMLRHYPVVNFKVNDRFARRGDLLWALLSQLLGGKKIIEHTFSIQQVRPLSPFDADRELEKSAYDIIGYAFNKAILGVFQQIQSEGHPVDAAEFLSVLHEPAYFDFFRKTYRHYLKGRELKFLMNYYRIRGLTQLLSKDFDLAKRVLLQLSDATRLTRFSDLLAASLKDAELQNFISTLPAKVNSFRLSLETAVDLIARSRSIVEANFSVGIGLVLLGNGEEGAVFSDGKWVYKHFYGIEERHWAYLLDKASCFGECAALESITLCEADRNRLIRYPYHSFKVLEQFDPEMMIAFLRFGRKHSMVFTNIKPSNFVLTDAGVLKFVDYGRSIEAYSEDYFLNATKRAYLLCRFPEISDSSFREVVKKINRGEIPDEIVNWEGFYERVMQ